MTWDEIRELEEVRQGYRQFKMAVLAALGHTEPWDLTVISESGIAREIESLRAALGRSVPAEPTPQHDELVREVEHALRAVQNVSTYDDLLLRCYDALRGAPPQGEPPQVLGFPPCPCCGGQGICANDCTVLGEPPPRHPAAGHDYTCARHIRVDAHCTCEPGEPPTP